MLRGKATVGGHPFPSVLHHAGFERRHIMTEHLEIRVGFAAWLGKGVTVESTADRNSGLLGHLLHGARVGDAVEEQRVYALLPDLSGETRQLGRGRLTVVGPT